MSKQVEFLIATVDNRWHTEIFEVPIDTENRETLTKWAEKRVLPEWQGVPVAVIAVYHIAPDVISIEAEKEIYNRSYNCPNCRESIPVGTRIGEYCQNCGYVFCEEVWHGTTR